MINIKPSGCNIWFIESNTPTNLQVYGIDKTIFSGESKFHKIDIVQTLDFGKCLILDGHARVFELDEFIYHESLTLPMLSRLRRASRVLLAGDGDGGGVRELLKSELVVSLDWVDIDSQVVNACKDHLGITPATFFEDKRLSIIEGDANDFLGSNQTLYDAIVLSVSEPQTDGISAGLYTKQFYELVASRLASGGLLVVQSGCSSIHSAKGFANVVATLQEVFRFVAPYQIGLPSFGLNWGFTLCSSTEIPEPVSLTRETKMYDLTLDKVMFSLPKYLLKVIDSGEIQHN